MASLYDDLKQRKEAREQYITDNPNPNRLQKPMDYSPEANRQKGANMLGFAGGLYTGLAGIGGDIEALVRAELQSSGALDEIGYFIANKLPLPDHLKAKIAQAQAVARQSGQPSFTEELGRIFDESDTTIHNSMDAREDVINFFNDDGLGNSVLKNTFVGDNGIGKLLKEADEGSWLTGEILSPTRIPKISKNIKKTAEDFIDTGNNIGDKVVDNVVQTTKSVKDAGKSIYQTLEEGMSPELVTTNGQTVKVSDVKFDNQPMQSAEYFDGNGINEVTGVRTVGDGHLQDYNRGLEEAIETEKIQRDLRVPTDDPRFGSNELAPEELENVKNKFVEDFYAKNPDLIDEGVIRIDQDGRSVLRKQDEVVSKELKDKPLFSGGGTKGSADTNELFGDLANKNVLSDTDLSMRTFSVDDIVEGSALEKLVGKDIKDLIEVRMAHPNILAKEKINKRQMSTSEIIDEIKGIYSKNGGKYSSPDASFSQGTTLNGVKAGNYIDDANFNKATLGWIEETGGVASNARVMKEVDKMIESGIFVKPKDATKIAKLGRFDAPYTEIDTKGKFDRLPPLLKQKVYNEAERLATLEEINQWAQKNRKQLTRYDATNIEPLMVSRSLKYDGMVLKDWVKMVENKSTTSTKPYDEQIREIALGINPNTGKKFSSFKADEETFIHELENHLNQRVHQGNRGGSSGHLMKLARIDDSERKFFDSNAVEKYDYNQYQGFKGESEARFGERNWKSTNEELVETGRSGFDRFPKEHGKNYFSDNGKKYDYYDEQGSSDFYRPIENSRSRIVAGEDEANILKIVKKMMKDPAVYEFKIKNALIRAKGENPYDLMFNAPIPATAKEAKLGSHLEHTPKNPSPEVGDRFEVEFAGGLEAKRLADIEAMKNGSILPMIWDSSSANYYVRSVSGHSFKYPKQFMTHGGDDFSRVIKNQEQGIGGASNYDVVKMIRNRVDEVRKLNLEKGGSGDVFLMTRRMSPYRTGGNHPMDFSVQPTQLSLAILDNQPLMKADIARLDKSIREMPVTKNKVTTYPFKNFKGIMSPKGRDQLFGIGKVGTSAGNLRKAFMNRMAIKQNQKAFHFNIEDVDMALTDPALRGVPYGYMGNAIIKAPDEGIKVVKGKNASYPYDFGGKYFGTMNHNFHMRTLYGKQYDEVLEELTKKNKTNAKPKTNEAVHSQVVDALSKRKNLNQSSVFVDNDVYETLKGLQRPLEQSNSGGLLETKSLWGYPDQKISSAGTSINSTKPAEAFTKLLKKDAFKKGSKNLDIGGGKFDNVNDLLTEKAGATNVVYDPFNRSKAHNAKVVKKMAGGKSDTVTVNNTLNVIEDTPNQIRVLEQAKDAVKKDGKVYISVYEGDRTGKGRPTSKGWQRHQKVEDYLETVKQVFPNARIENKLIVIDN